MGEKDNPVEYIKEMVEYHKHFTRYHHVLHYIHAGKYGVWDFDKEEGREYILTELRNLERKGLNLLTLACAVMDNKDMSEDEFQEAVMMIYDDNDRTNHNLKNNGGG